jgi:hypothetical protein
MTASTKYFHDRLILLLLSTNVFLAFFASILILLRLGSSHGSIYIVQCRDCSNPAALDKFAYGGVTQILSFVIFVFLILAVHIMLSLRAYHIHRQLSVVILSLSLILLVLAVIVSNALLVLR